MHVTSSLPFKLLSLKSHDVETNKMLLAKDEICILIRTHFSLITLLSAYNVQQQSYFNVQCPLHTEITTYALIMTICF